MNHKKPCGTEAFDQTYGLGYKVGHEAFSPYERVNRLRSIFLERNFDVDIQRARLITETYRENPDMPVKLKTACALENILHNVKIDLYEDELIVGEIAAPAKAAPVYPEFSVDWIIDELEHHPFDQREHDKFYITEENRDELLEIAKFWRGKTIESVVNAQLTEDEKKGCELGKKVYMTTLYHYGGIGHFVMDYEKLLKIGYRGYREAVEKQLSQPADQGQKQLYEAMLIEIKAASHYIYRYGELAETRGNQEKNPRRKKELLQIAENCRQIAEGPALTMWQALQLWYFATNITLIESNGHSVSYGRMDQWLYPYYEKDLVKGVITKEFAQELLECAYIKMGNPSKLKDRVTVSVRNGRGWGGESLTIGGVDEKGQDATNDLTFMMLEASAHTRMMNPWVCVRIHEQTPYELKVKAVECIRAGYGHPKLFNDVSAIAVMLRKGMTLEEARDYAVVGCVEPDLPGREYGFHDSAYMNLGKVLELSLNGGKCIDCGSQCPRYEVCAGVGRQLGPDTGNLREYGTMKEVLDGFERQMKFWTDQMCQGINVIDNAHRVMKPTPYASIFFDDCIGTGKDLGEGGAKYNFTGPQASGIATCADSLSAISQLVFDEKRYTGEQMLRAIADNWEGHDVLYALVNSSKVHHYGNDDDYADALFKEVFQCYCKNIQDRENPRGGTFCPGVYTVNANVGLGLGLGASLDGRKSSEPISDNMGPVHTSKASHDIYGPTCIANSVTKVQHSLATNGTLLNLKFSPECVAGTAGRENLISFIDTYFDKKAMHCQFNIMSTETMKRAMKKPEDYQDMLVRVAGYSAYFVELGRPLQMDLINRTELSF